MFNREVYINRRQQLKTAVQTGVILILGNEESSMNYKDNHYHFRQDSNFLYFAGLDRANLALVIDIDNNKETIFGDDGSIDDIIWTGPLETLPSQAAKAGINDTASYKSLTDVLAKAVNDKRPIHFTPPYRPENAQKISAFLNIPLSNVKENTSVTLIKAIVALRSIKSAEEVAEIEKAVSITTDMHLTAMRNARPGMTENELAGQIHGLALSKGGNIAFPIILTVNGQILHNHSHGNVLKEGMMVLCDSGAENSMRYGGDMTRTFPVGKTFTSRQKDLYNIVLNAHNAAVEALRPGVFYKDVHLLACEKLVDGLSAVGLMKGNAKEAVAAGAHAMFFQCGLGHMLGLDTHDMEDLGEEYVGYTNTFKKSKEFGLKSLRLGRQLEAGFVLTVEPGIYIIPELIDMWKAGNKHTEFINYDVLETYRDFGGIRIEEDFLITETGKKLLGSPIAKTVEEVEAERQA